MKNWNGQSTWWQWLQLPLERMTAVCLQPAHSFCTSFILKTIFLDLFYFMSLRALISCISVHANNSWFLWLWQSERALSSLQLEVWNFVAHHLVKRNWTQVFYKNSVPSYQQTHLSSLMTLNCVHYVFQTTQHNTTQHQTKEKLQENTAHRKLTCFSKTDMEGKLFSFNLH